MSEKIRVGTSRDEQGTRKYMILDETLSGKYVVMPLVILHSSPGQGIDTYSGKPFLSAQPLLLKNKDEIQDIHEEEVT